MKRRGLLDDVVQSLPSGRPGFAPWYERMPQEVREELEEIRRRFHAGELATRSNTLARVLSAKLAERNLVDIGAHTINRWLAKKP